MRTLKFYNKECRKDKGGCGHRFQSETRNRMLCDKCKSRRHKASLEKRWLKREASIIVKRNAKLFKD